MCWELVLASEVNTLGYVIILSNSFNSAPENQLIEFLSVGEFLES